MIQLEIPGGETHAQNRIYADLPNNLRLGRGTFLGLYPNRSSGLNAVDYAILKASNEAQNRFVDVYSRLVLHVCPSSPWLSSDYAAHRCRCLVDITLPSPLLTLKEEDLDRYVRAQIQLTEAGRAVLARENA